MIDMIGKLKDLTMNRDGTQNITVTISEDFREAFDELKDKDIKIEIKKYSERRSLNANSYLWALCSEIAKKVSKVSKDGKLEIYKDAIRAKGEFEPLLIREEAVEIFVSRWSDKGDGWFVDIIDDYKPGYKVIHAYYGSSTYDSLSMSRIIDYVVMLAEEQGIPTITENEKEKLLTLWNKKKG